MAEAAEIAAFRGEFAEFRAASDALIGSRLDMAEARLGGIWTGAKRDQGKLFLTAHLVSIAPGGREMALTSEDGSSIYEPQFLRLQRSVTAGRRALTVFGG